MMGHYGHGDIPCRIKGGALALTGKIQGFGQFEKGPHYHVVVWDGQTLPSIVLTECLEMKDYDETHWHPPRQR